MSKDEDKLEVKDKNGENNKDNVESNENDNKSVANPGGWYNLGEYSSWQWWKEDEGENKLEDKDVFNKDKDSNENDNKSVANPRGASCLCLVGTRGSTVVVETFQKKLPSDYD